MELGDWHRWYKARGGSELRTLLMDVWDPIGVAGIPEAADEYDAYIGRILAKLRAGTDEPDLALFLHSARTESMGLDPDPAADREASESILTWYGASALGNPARSVVACPACRSRPDRVDLVLNVRSEDGRRVCIQRIECPRGHGAFWRWADRPADVLQPEPERSV